MTKNNRTNSEDMIAELVEETLDWVTYGEANTVDLIELATAHFNVVAYDHGFRSDGATMLAAADFLRDGAEVSCRVELISDVVGVVTEPTTLVLTINGKAITYPTHREGLMAFYRWAAQG